MSTITTSPPTAGPAPLSAGKTILLAVLVAGTLDIISAILLNGAISGTIRPVRLLQAIAAAAFGKSAFTGGAGMALAGLLFHYFIAFCFTVGYFLVYPYIRFLHKHPIISGLLYGIVVWVVMNRIVLPMTRLQLGPFQWDKALMHMGILMLMIGLPISLFTHKYYSGKTRYSHE